MPEKRSLGWRRPPKSPRSPCPHPSRLSGKHWAPPQTAPPFPALPLPGPPSVRGGSGRQPLPAQTACFHEGQWDPRPPSGRAGPQGRVPREPARSFARPRGQGAGAVNIHPHLCVSMSLLLALDFKLKGGFQQPPLARMPPAKAHLPSGSPPAWPQERGWGARSTRWGGAPSAALGTTSAPPRPPAAKLISKRSRLSAPTSPGWRGRVRAASSGPSPWQG